MNRWLNIFICMLAVQWASTSAAAAMRFDEARHLLSRTSFAGDWEQIQALTRMEYDEAVSLLLEGTRTSSTVPPPKWVDDRPLLYISLRFFPRIKTHRILTQRAARSREAKTWWFREMIRTDSPLTERMTLFWHNHFTSSIQKVRSPVLLYHQNQLLRKHALGNFREMTHAVARDPAMIIYLDNASNVKGKPNENFARELLELFTLGEGHYTERDIKECARAFTGWSIDRKAVTFQFIPQRHDAGPKEFMGRKGNFGGDEIIDIIFEQPRTAKHMTERLWREFVSETPDPAEVRRLAGIFRDNDYEIKPLMFALLTSRAFRDRRNHGTMIKSPVELIIGTIRMLEWQPGNVYGLTVHSRKLGQDVLNPPNVKGWPGGKAWITSDTLGMRYELLDRFTRGQEMMQGRMKRSPRGMQDTAAQMTTMGSFAEGLNSEEVTRLLLPLPPVAPVQQTYFDRQEMISSLVLDPVFQLK
jgi:uncharacterized protein (DUF1800 family)